MTDTLSLSERSDRMRLIKSKDAKPDIRVTASIDQICRESLILHLSVRKRLSLFMGAFGTNMIAENTRCQKVEMIIGCLNYVTMLKEIKTI